MTLIRDAASGVFWLLVRLLGHDEVKVIGDLEVTHRRWWNGTLVTCKRLDRACDFCGCTYGYCLTLESSKYCRTSSVPSAHQNTPTTHHQQEKSK